MENHTNPTKKYTLFFFLSIPALLIWSTLTYLQISSHSQNITVTIQTVQWLIDIINISLITYLLKKSSDKTEGLGLLTSIAFLFLLDIIYFIVYSWPQQTKYIFIFDIAHFIYYAITITLIVNLLLKNVLSPYKLIKLLIFAIIIDAGIFVVFSVDTRYLTSPLSITQSIIDLVLFSLAFLWLMYSRTLGSALISAGYILCTSSEFMLTSCYMTNMLSLLVYGELGWLLGLIFIMTGMIFIITNRQYNIKKWMETRITIRTNLILHTFSMIVISLIIFYLILKECSVINENLYIFFPTIIMDFTLIIALFSILSSRKIEQPLLQRQNDIKKPFTINKKDISE